MEKSETIGQSHWKHKTTKTNNLEHIKWLKTSNQVVAGCVSNKKLNIQVSNIEYKIRYLDQIVSNKSLNKLRRQKNNTRIHFTKLWLTTTSSDGEAQSHHL